MNRTFSLLLLKSYEIKIYYLITLDHKVERQDALKGQSFAKKKVSRVLIEEFNKCMDCANIANLLN